MYEYFRRGVARDVLLVVRLHVPEFVRLSLGGAGRVVWRSQADLHLRMLRLIPNSEPNLGGMVRFSGMLCIAFCALA